MNESQNRSIAIALVILILLIGGLYLFTAPDERNFAQRTGDAIEELSEGGNNAAREFEDRTPAERLGDAAGDIGNDLDRPAN